MRKIASVGKRLWLLSLSLLMFGFVSGQITVTGVITDISDAGGGEPVIGANVVVKGTTTGTATDFDGNYSITVPDGNAVLVYSFIGLESQEIKVGSRTKIDVALDVNSKKVDEVIVMGYMEQKKEDATSATASIGGGDINDKPTLGVDKALQGKAAGVRVISNSGAPGSGVQVQIRGMTSMSGSKPLYVVDGVPRGYEINDLNPGDIESINILKDASATALYGARGAAGVVVIKTKGGSKFSRKSCEENFVVTVDGFYGVQQAWRLPELTTGQQWIDLNNAENLANPKRLSDTLIPYAYKDSVSTTSWLDEVFRTASIQKYQVSLEGSSEKSTYAISGSYFNQEGIVLGSDYQRFTGRFKSTHRINKYVTIGDNIGFNTKIENKINEGDVWTGVVPNAIVFDPTVPVYTWDSTFTEIVGLDGQVQKIPTGDSVRNWSKGRGYIVSSKDSSETLFNKDYKNPVGMIETRSDQTTGYGFGGNLFMNVDLYKNLSFRTTGNFGLWGNEQTSYDAVHDISGGQSRNQSQLIVVGQDGKSITVSNILTYSLDIMNADSSMVTHGFNFMVGNEYLYEKQKAIRTKAFGMSDDENMRYLIAGTDGVVEIESWRAPSENSMASYMGRMEYVLLNKYLFNATVRRDGSSRFGVNSRWGVFPALGLGWKIHEENFIKNNESLAFISTFRLRGGWGRIGNANIGNYAYTANVINDQRSRYTFGNNVVTGSTLLSLPNENIRWEETETSNVGLDLSFLDQKISFSADLYRKLTYDMLIREPQPAVVGSDGDNNAPFSNAGEMKNVGSEFSARYKAYEKAFQYEFGANISFNTNEVSYLGDETIGSTYIVGGLLDQPKWDLSRTQVGHSVAEFYGYQTDGIYQSWEEVNQGSDPNARPGSTRFVDINGDGKITPDDQTFIGSPHAKFNYGFDLGGSYKGVDFSMSWSGVYGNSVFNAMKYYTYGGRDYSNRSVDAVNVWTSESTSGTTNRKEDYLDRPSDLYVEDGSYLRLKTLVIGYTIPKSLTQKVYINKLRAYVSAENLLTFTKYSGLDPEVGVNELVGYGGPELGIDRGVYPQAKVYSLGFSLTF